ncbi:MAG: hypothetical protein D6714_07745 [Bacteroidetes bacterium]|nr:MAG: hypothetical protein D6714_07745 [Bacteroidota bacterium]
MFSKTFYSDETRAGNGGEGKTCGTDQDKPDRLFFPKKRNWPDGRIRPAGPIISVAEGFIRVFSSIE